MDANDQKSRPTSASSELDKAGGAEGGMAGGSAGGPGQEAAGGAASRGQPGKGKEAADRTRAGATR
jgi:hypothetical protein